MRNYLALRGYGSGIKRRRRLMRGGASGRVPEVQNQRDAPRAYALPIPVARDMIITRPNQVWGADITYLPMCKDFLYLVAIMD